MQSCIVHDIPGDSSHPYLKSHALRLQLHVPRHRFPKEGKMQILEQLTSWYPRGHSMQKRKRIYLLKRLSNNLCENVSEHRKILNDHDYFHILN